MKTTSVHLENFPDTSRLPSDQQMVQLMDRVRDICNAALSIRSKENIRVRQPLLSLKVIGSNLAGVMPFTDIIKDEVNVKKIEFDTDVSTVADYKLQINFPVLGKRLPAKVKEIIPAAKQGKWKKSDNGTIEIAGEILEKNECAILLEPKDKKTGQAVSTQDALVLLDLTLNPELIDEGIARDVVRMIQQSRRDANLNVSDHISLFIDAPDEVLSAITNNQDYIKEQTLATILSTSGKAEDAKFNFTHEFDDKKITIGISMVS